MGSCADQRDLGTVQVKMITGDQLLIGKETAKQLGMGTNMFTTEALLKVCYSSLRKKQDLRKQQDRL